MFYFSAYMTVVQMMFFGGSIIHIFATATYIGALVFLDKFEAVMGMANKSILLSSKYIQSYSVIY